MVSVDAEFAVLNACVVDNGVCSKGKMSWWCEFYFPIYNFQFSNILGDDFFLFFGTPCEDTVGISRLYEYKMLSFFSSSCAERIF